MTDVMLDLKTIFVYSAAINFSIVIVATIAWMRNPRQKDILFWFAAGWSIVFGGAVMGSQQVLPYHLADYFGGMLYVGSTGLLRLGFMEFFGRRYRLFDAFSIAAVICIGMVFVQHGPDDTRARIAMLYAGSCINLALTACALWQGKAGERLPSRLISVCIFGAYAFANACIVPLAMIYPVTFSNGLPVSEWLGYSSMLLVFFNMASFLMAVVLKLERSGEIQRQLAERDALTGIFNRRMFLAHAEAAISNGDVVAIVDLDHFKRINDAYGHGGGDAALVHFSATAQGLLPKGAVFGRLGGEEFGIFLPRSDEITAGIVLDRLRIGLAEAPVAWQSGSFSLTLSCGFVMTDGRTRSLDAWIADADRALYAAKHAGRNLALVYDAAKMSAPIGAEIQRRDVVAGNTGDCRSQVA